MIELKAPNKLTPQIEKAISNFTTVFTAGSIEMGVAEKWQDKLASQFEDDLIFFNPRRDSWDSSWIQDPTPGTQFSIQVEWELEHIEKADIVVFYFDPKTQSPITLLELGSCLGADKDVIVCCPD